MTRKKYLTKSRFKSAYECPRKLYYAEHADTYGNLLTDNDFLKTLAQGGFQVGALAKVFYEGGHDLEGLGTEEAIQKTADLLKLDNIVIFEAALQIDDYLVRVDILEKIGNTINLIEVKSKSHDFPSEENGFFTKKKSGLYSDWEPYLVDVAFQTWVARRYFKAPIHITPFLMLVDKTVTSDVNGLHQWFLLKPNKGKSSVMVRSGLSKKDCGKSILKKCDVSEEVIYLIEEYVFPTNENFSNYAKYLADHLIQDARALPRCNELCNKCEFRIKDETELTGLQSGFVECWVGSGKLKKEDSARPLVFDIWNLQVQKLLSKNILFIDQVKEEDLKPKSSRSEHPPYIRQMIQVNKVKERDPTPWINREGLKSQFDAVKWPIHCIDFETSMVAIPFHKGRRPYEQIAFQFSHHVLRENGSIEHRDQFIHLESDVFPNFDFVRRLKGSLEGDEGTIFRYASHENTVLRQIYDQLETTPTHDAEELKYFIDSLTRVSKTKDFPEQVGKRCMVDLLDIVRDNYYHPLMGGSNSIKQVIPAVLHDSQRLREKYSHPIYGKGLQIPSLNFDAMVWIHTEKDGSTKDPYKMLPSMFSDIPQEELDRLENHLLIDDSDINKGGAAMIAWARMQFTEMSILERDAVQKALLKYCELDTLSMVWLLEYFRSIVESV